MPHFALFSYLDADGRARPGLKVGGRMTAWRGFAMAHGLPLADATMLELIEGWPQVAGLLQPAWLDSASDDLVGARLTVPVVGAGLFCSGPNYHCHLEEMTRGKPGGMGPPRTEPYFFTKPAVHTLIGPGDPIVLPSQSQKLDWEAELAVVIGKTARNVSVAQAMDHVFGYSILNDLSARDLIIRAEWPGWLDFLGGKGFDGAAPFGPAIVPASQIDDPQALTIKLWVNGTLHQNASTGQMVFGIAQQIAFLSSRVTLRPGDIVATGTPAGVGMPRNLFLRAGDMVRIEIEGLGIDALENPVVAHDHFSQGSKPQ